MKRKIGEIKKFPHANFESKKVENGEIVAIVTEVEICSIGKHIAIIQPIGVPLARIEVDARKVTSLNF